MEVMIIYLKEYDGIVLKHAYEIYYYYIHVLDKITLCFVEVRLRYVWIDYVSFQT
jgi:hypothetical protein